jgi:hypothetical protein
MGMLDEERSGSKKEKATKEKGYAEKNKCASFFSKAKTTAYDY